MPQLIRREKYFRNEISLEAEKTTDNLHSSTFTQKPALKKERTV